MTKPEMGEGTARPEGSPSSGGGGRGGLVAAVVVCVILALAMAFLWNKEKQAVAKLEEELGRGGGVSEKVKDLTAERDQLRKEIRQLRDDPVEHEAAMESLEAQVAQLQKQASFAEVERESAAEKLIECQTENLALKQSMIEADARIAELSKPE